LTVALTDVKAGMRAAPVLIVPSCPETLILKSKSTVLSTLKVIDVLVALKLVARNPRTPLCGSMTGAGGCGAGAGGVGSVGAGGASGAGGARPVPGPDSSAELPAASVAVAVIVRPSATAPVRNVNDALPPASVVTSLSPR